MRDHGSRLIKGAAALGFCLLVLLAPRSSWACAACFGQDSGPMAQGMNWGIFSLLGIIVSVLAGVAGFFVYLARRSVPVSGTASSELASGQAHSGKVTTVFKPGEPRPQTA